MSEDSAMCSPKTAQSSSFKVTRLLPCNCVLAACFGSGLLFGCSRHADVPQDYEAICKKHCAQVFECDADPVHATEQECVSSCSAPDHSFWKTRECNDAAKAMLTCITDLTCEQYDQHQADLESSPCWDVTYEFSACIAKEGDN